MLFEPQTVVHLLSNVPLKDYNNQMDFESKDAQTQYFLSKISVTVPEQGDNHYTYQRKNSSIIVPYVADQLYNICYVMFRNNNFTDKWFYAFVKDVQYKNTTSSILILELDEWQTWQFDIKFKTSFVEREHIANDTFGASLIDEGLATGDYVTNQYSMINLSDCWIAVSTTVSFDSNNFTPVSGRITDGIYTGTAIYTFDNVASLQSIIYALAEAGKSDAITGMYMLPKECTYDQHNGEMIQWSGDLKKEYAIPTTNTLNGYSPRNQKLLQYPYRACVVTATTGGSAQLRYEFLTSNQLTMRANRGPSGTVVLYPNNYKGVQNNVGEGVQLEPYQQCQWVKDNYLNWNAVQQIRYRYDYENVGIQATNKLVNQGINRTEALATNLLNAANITSGVGQIIGAATDATKTVINANYDMNMITRNLQEEREVFSLVPPSAKGGMSGTPLFVANRYGFMVENRSITYDYARAIDTYFTMYGYKVNRAKDINFRTRPNWNFIKTNGVIITGCIPGDSIHTIMQMFDNGCTIWHTDDIGNYNLPNGEKPLDNPHTVTVNRGTGSGSYYNGDRVSITADPAPTNQVFSQWVLNSGDGTIAQPSAVGTYYTMGSTDAVITATYTTSPEANYGLNVINGYGSGTYRGDEQIPIEAMAIEGQTFNHWQVNSGAATIQDTTSPETWCTLNNSDSVVEAVFSGGEPVYNTIADAMASGIGAVEWDATVGAIQIWYYGSYVKSAWCTTSLTYYASKVGVSSQVPKNANVDTLWNRMSTVKWYTPQYGGTLRYPKRGDVIFFSNRHTTADLTHVGVVSKVSGTSISYISGNTTNPTSGGPDGIFEHTIDITDMYVVCFAQVTY